MKFNTFNIKKIKKWINLRRYNFILTINKPLNLSLVHMTKKQLNGSDLKGKYLINYFLIFSSLKPYSLVRHKNNAQLL